MRTTLAASLAALSYADSRAFFAGAPVHAPGPMPTATALSQAATPFSALEASPYIQPVEFVQPMASSQTGEGMWPYAAAAALLVGAVTAVRGQYQGVADLDVESANSAARVAMLFTSGRSAGPKKAAKGKKAPAKGGFFGGGASTKKPARAPVVDDDDLFVHEGTQGFQGDENAFVYRAGLAALAVAGREVPSDVEAGFAEDDEVPDKVAMLFTSGRSAGPKKAAKGKKPAPAKGGFFGGGASAKKPARAPAVDDDDLFVHEGTQGFQGDENAFVYRAGLVE